MTARWKQGRSGGWRQVPGRRRGFRVGAGVGAVALERRGGGRTVKMAVAVRHP